MENPAFNRTISLYGYPVCYHCIGSVKVKRSYDNGGWYNKKFLKQWFWIIMSSKSVQKMLSLKLQQHLSLCGASFCLVFGPNEAYAAYLFNLI